MNWLKKFIQSIKESNDYLFEERISELKEQHIIALQIKQLEIDEQTKYINDLNEELSLLSLEVEELESKLDDKFLEYYWNHKIKPLKSLSYKARNNKVMNVLKYFVEENDRVPVMELEDYNYDYLANECLKWVKNNVKYTSDKGEHWQWANETVALKTGDCEDGAILMANMMLKAGIPYWRVRLNAGDVKGGGHAYVTYLREKDNKWYVLDWSYWYNESINFKKKWVDAKKYFGIWFSWNKQYGFMKAELDR